jgi:hypothetical protein
MTQLRSQQASQNLLLQKGAEINIYICIYITYKHIYVHTHIYVYIYRERKRASDESERVCVDQKGGLCLWFIPKNKRFLNKFEYF